MADYNKIYDGLEEAFEEILRDYRPQALPTSVPTEIPPSLELWQPISPHSFVDTLSDAGAIIVGTLKKPIEDPVGALKEGAANLEENVREKIDQGVDYVKRRAAALELAVRTEVGRGVATLKDTWWYSQFRKNLLDLFMETPTFIRVNEHLEGEPVYYVNGILTTKHEATTAAKILSEHLNRPVLLIHNPTMIEAPWRTGTPDFPDDVSESIYDRLWVVEVLIPFQQLPWASLEALLKRSSTFKLQLNPTTRQVTHLMYHAARPISIVSHSQGCIIVRNACFALFLLGKETWVRNRLAWVAAGNPLNNNEIWPPPAKYQALRNDKDWIAKWLAFSGNVGKQNMTEGHSFIDSYYEQITPQMLWSPNDKSVETSEDDTTESRPEDDTTEERPEDNKSSWLEPILYVMM